MDLPASGASSLSQTCPGEVIGPFWQLSHLARNEIVSFSWLHPDLMFVNKWMPGSPGMKVSGTRHGFAGLSWIS